ncbi:TPA: phosphoenolpyruvate synthase [Candidatus Delongbacteria bacterium]|nr:MAG: phosphoenolpyruvate synthase [Candidatus Delongbacteria bacterium GWF2_40_14]HAQ60878.1 phosphoenolpyruvate synthase [Candidatus Delongbacteria bacterium]
MELYDIKKFSEEKYYFEEEPFGKLMQKTIKEVLLICSKYDEFMLEVDGRIDEHVFQEYVSLSIRNPPHFTQVSTQSEAFEMLKKKRFDLVITMVNLGDIMPFELSRKIKSQYPDIPIVVLTHFSREVSSFLANKDLKYIDYVFSWLGDSSILLAIIKLIEDKMNVEHDVNEVGAYCIILVEDSIRYYSSYLPNMYKILFNQTISLMAEGLNEHQKTMRMRARAKILLANNYEQAVELYSKYKSNLLGVISDITYKIKGKDDNKAGIKLCKMIRKENPHLPILLQSSQMEFKNEVEKFHADFLFKHSKTLLNELREYIKLNFGFGDFIFVDPETNDEIVRATDLRDLQNKIENIPINSFEYHAANNHFSKWFKARALFTLADIIKDKKETDFESIEATRDYVYRTIKNYRIHTSKGTIATFNKDFFDDYTGFSRIGKGSLGGKGRGLAFIDSFLKNKRINYKYEDVIINIPKTIVLSTDIFEEFMQINNLYDFALSEVSDEKILQYFVLADLPPSLKEDLYCILTYIRTPIAVRSSSLLEDSYFQPFAGVYTTYMIPNNDMSISVRLKELSNAIKGVFASTFFKASKDYMKATHNVIDEEKMAVVIQEVTGKLYAEGTGESRFYPSLSGVARSLNFYPVGDEKYEDGVVNIALGLGKTIVDGETSLRFSPKYPKKILQISTADMTLKNTQKMFYALDMEKSFCATTDEKHNLIHLDVEKAEEDESLKLLVSTYDFENSTINDGYMENGKKLLTFAPILKYDMFPLAEIVSTLLEYGSREMNSPVEIEFALELDKPADRPKIFRFLQIRPIVHGLEYSDVKISEKERKEALIHSVTSLGNGTVEGIKDIIYVRTENFNPANTEKIAVMLEKINDKFLKSKKNYILIGPGRWGSSDPWLGIPVKWAQISQAKVIIEHGLKDFHIDPSQGSHFFQNITLLKIVYFTINPYLNQGNIDIEYLNAQNSITENDLIRHIKLDKPLKIKVNGMTSEGIIAQ